MTVVRPQRCAPTADALLKVVTEHQLAPDHIKRVTAQVHQAAIDVLGPVTDPTTVHQAKFSMGTVLAAIATFRRAGLVEFEHHFRDPGIVAFRDRVRMVHDAEVEAAYPQRWIGKVEVETTDGRTLAGRVDEPKGDPGNTLTRAELADKALRLAEFSGAATPAEVQALCADVFAIASAARVEVQDHRDSLRGAVRSSEFTASGWPATSASRSPVPRGLKFSSRRATETAAASGVSRR